MPKPRLLAALDVGSTKITALLAEAGSNGTVRLVGSGIATANGILRGSVTDPESATSSVRRAIDGLGDAKGYRPPDFILCTSLAASSQNARGSIVSARNGHSFTGDDVRRAVAAAADVVTDGSTVVVHAIPRNFVVDRDSGFRDPTGLAGQRLDADVHLVAVSASSLKTLVQCVEACGVRVVQVVSQPIAAAEAVLTSEDRERGVAVADIGFASTEVVVFVDGAPWHTATIPVGGKHITQDLSIVLRIPYESGESLKLAVGCAELSAEVARDVADVLVTEEHDAAEASSETVREIIEARVVELIGLIDGEINRSGYAGLLPDGLIITGGTSHLSGIVKVASQHLQMRVRIGHPGDLDQAGTGGPAYASAIGSIYWHLAASWRNCWSYPDPVGLSTGTLGTRRAAPWWRSIWSLNSNVGNNDRAVECHD